MAVRKAYPMVVMWVDWMVDWLEYKRVVQKDAKKVVLSANQKVDLTAE